MSIYKDFAYYYDLFMDDIPYDEWSKYIQSLLVMNGLNEGVVCELGCGTGEITMRLKKAGYDMIGIDISEDMLMQARDKMYEALDDEIDEDSEDFEAQLEANQIIYLKQDMRDFELYGTVDAFVCVCDSLNYITEYDDLVEVFKKVNNYLEKDGLFVFDMKTEYFYKNVLGNNHFKQEREEGVLVWDNSYDEQTHENVYDITIDIYGEDNMYDELKEHHIQKSYSIDQIVAALAKAGLKLEGVYNAFTLDKPAEESERVYFVAREGFQPNKTYINE